MISFSKFQSLSPQDKEAVIIESVGVDVSKGNFGQLIKDIVDAATSQLFAVAYKRFKEHSESVKWNS